MISRINELDHKHLLAFPAHRKAQVMKKIMSLKPLRSEVLQGKNEYEKAVIKIHRDGYGLIDMVPQETVFTTLWYRKSTSFVGKGADVTLLLWEDGDEGDDKTTLTRWKI